MYNCTYQETQSKLVDELPASWGLQMDTAQRASPQDGRFGVDGPQAVSTRHVSARQMRLVWRSS